MSIIPVRRVQDLPVPRPEHPRPDWQRDDWLNLNGAWSFRFDPENEGLAGDWHMATEEICPDTITVPFSWASPLSGIGQDVKGAAWYRRTVEWQPEQPASRLFLRFGAVDYSCEVWVNGMHVGSHQGGYTTFEMEVTAAWKADADNVIVVRAEDTDHNSQARGKQGYGEIRGIWQPVWLEARPQSYISGTRFTTRIDGTVEAAVTVTARQAGTAKLEFVFAAQESQISHEVEVMLEPGEQQVRTSFTVMEPQLWSPDTPNLYEGELKLAGEFGTDAVRTYFGIREIGTGAHGGKHFRWVLLNGKPVYLNGTLDQSYHATGYFTYPTDREMQEEIYLMKRLGLNFVRIHIKPEEPRKLYWADKLGLLVMEDMPCFWGNPDERAQAAYEAEAEATIERDYNHPSIFSWVLFNETWGLKTDGDTTSVTGDGAQRSRYLPLTQKWVRERYHWAKAFDPTRIIEDNSPCNGDHVETDLNTWHFYLNGYETVRNHMQEVTERTFPGSDFNYIGGHVQSDAPLMNSECGNVWGIDGGGGDSDLAWHYRYMLNEFRKHEKMCGFVFTEFRDVTNEFNGYYRLDGTDKDFGYGAFVPGMGIRDLHAADFIVIDAPPCQTAAASEQLSVSLLRSSFSDRYHGQPLAVNWELWYDRLGERVVEARGSKQVEWSGYGVEPLESIQLQMPSRDAVAVLAVWLAEPSGTVIMRNFATFDVRGGEQEGTWSGAGADGWRELSLPVTGYAESTFAYTFNTIAEAKVNGGTEGRLVYEIELPAEAELGCVGEVEIFFEASAKRLLARHIEGTTDTRKGVDFMHGESAQVEYNSNTSYMTDEARFESTLTVSVDGEEVSTVLLPDDPADARGVLSWHYQPETRKLDEAGSYGYLCRIVLPGRIASKLNARRRLRLELAADEGGLSLYGRNAGRHPVDLLVRVRGC